MGLRMETEQRYIREMGNEKSEDERKESLRIILFGFRFLRYFADYLAEDQMTVEAYCSLDPSILKSLAHIIIM